MQMKLVCFCCRCAQPFSLSLAITEVEAQAIAGRLVCPACAVQVRLTASRCVSRQSDWHPPGNRSPQVKQCATGRIVGQRHTRKIKGIFFPPQIQSGLGVIAYSFYEKAKIQKTPT